MDVRVGGRRLVFLDRLVPFPFGAGDVSIMRGRTNLLSCLGWAVGSLSGTSGKTQANPSVE